VIHIVSRPWPRYAALATNATKITASFFLYRRLSFLIWSVCCVFQRVISVYTSSVLRIWQSRATRKRTAHQLSTPSWSPNNQVRASTGVSLISMCCVTLGDVGFSGTMVFQLDVVCKAGCFKSLKLWHMVNNWFSWLKIDDNHIQSCTDIGIKTTTLSGNVPL